MEESGKLEADRLIAYSLTTSKRAKLQVEVTEIFGSNIECEVRQKGKLLFKSGVKDGFADASGTVEKGDFEVIVRNGNLLMSKNYRVKAVLAHYGEKGAPDTAHPSSRGH